MLLKIISVTRKHLFIKVRDVYCKNCEAKLGWMYEFATNEDQVAYPKSKFRKINFFSVIKKERQF